MLWASPGPSPLEFILTLVPPRGAITPIMGAVAGLADPTNYAACLLVGNNFTAPAVDTWWGPKPGPGHCFQLDALGSFVASNWASDFHDWNSPQLSAFIVPMHVVQGSLPNHSAGTTDLNNWFSIAAAWTFVTRPSVISSHIVVPPRGLLAPVTGCFYDLPMSTSSYKVALYVQTVGNAIYGSKPVQGKLYHLNSTGCFNAPDWFSHPNDAHIPFIQVILLPTGLNPPQMNGQTSFDSWWLGKFVYYVRKLRTAGTPSPTRTPSFTPSHTPSVSGTPSITPSHTPSHTPSISVTSTISRSPTHTPSNTVTPSVTSTVSRTPSISSTPAITPSNSAAPTVGPRLIVDLPPIGSGAPITGYAINVPGGCRNWKLLAYVRSNNTDTSTGGRLLQWWGPKPGYPIGNSNGNHRALWQQESGAGNWWFPLNDDCTFSIPNWASDAMDFTVPTIGLFLVPRGIPFIPQVNGETSLPSNLLSWTLASFIGDRPRTAYFAAAKAPALGKTTPITATVLNLPEDVENYRAIVFVYSPNGGWWGPKPVANFAYPLKAFVDGSSGFDAQLYLPNWASAPEDRFTPVIRVDIVRVEFVEQGKLQSITTSGAPTLPELLLSGSVASVTLTRAEAVAYPTVAVV